MLILLISNSYSSTVTWTGGSGDWENASNWDTGNLPTYDDSVIIPSGIVKIYNYATARNIHIQGGVLKVFGDLILQVDQALPGGHLNALRIDAGTSFYNTGVVVMLEYAYVPGLGKLIHNYGDFENDTKGYIYLNGQSYTGIHNQSAASFINRGQLEMQNMQSGIYSLSPCNNYGSIDIESTSHSLYIRDDFYASSSSTIGVNNIINVTSTGNMNNYGDIDVDSNGSPTYGIQMSGIWNSQSNSSVTVSGNYGTGISCSSGSTFRNRGLLTVESEQLYTTALSIAGFFVNHQSGTITTQSSYGVGVSGSGLNYGTWHMTSPNIGGVRSINNSGSFNNRPKGKLYMDHIIKVNPGSTFNNQGHMFSSYIYNQTAINGTFNNTGCLNDLHGKLPAINNSSIIVEPLNASPQVNVPIANALYLGNSLGATVLAWYTTASGNTLAGSYNSSTNTFTPNANAVGLSSLYVRTRINIGGVTRRHEIQFDDPVIALSQNESHEIQNQETFTSSISTYPNPATDYIIVSDTNKQSQLSTISLINLGGRIVYSADCDNREKCIIHIPENIQNGLYFIRVNNKAGGMSETRTIKVFR